MYLRRPSACVPIAGKPMQQTGSSSKVFEETPMALDDWSTVKVPPRRVYKKSAMVCLVPSLFVCACLPKRNCTGGHRSDTPDPPLSDDDTIVALLLETYKIDPSSIVSVHR